MLSVFDGLRGMGFGAVLFRMVAACVCGALIGLERSSKNRPAGFRTHILVCLGAATAAVTGLYIYLEMKLPADITRISGQVITGLGFIGAGTIIITKCLTIKGLTTAAGLWTTGIIGLAVGSGYYEIAIAGTALVLLAETWIGRLGSAIIQPAPEYAVELLYNEKTSLDHVLRYCKDHRMAIANLKIQSLDDGEARYAAQVSLRGGVKQEELLDQVQRMPGIVNAIGI